MRVERCSEVYETLIYEAFKVGFSDYSIPFHLTEQQFVDRFFGPEGNRKEQSFIALDGEQAVGVLLGGIKLYDGMKTMRCGTLAVHPAYRGTGISQQLFALHRQEALDHGCKQLHLEVLVHNERAIKFYKKLGYEKVYDLSYYSLNDLHALHNYDARDTHQHEQQEQQEQETSLHIQIRQMELEPFVQFMQRLTGAQGIHINWQNDIDYIQKSPHMLCYGAYFKEQLVAVLGLNLSGSIHFIWTDPALRGRRIATSLLKEACITNNITKLRIGLPNNALMEGFLKRAGFAKDTLAQYEMYSPL
ncbi:GNAT family N-acetyltransferase [Paenibacillus sp. 481]|uniref:GNAT family N-acetyltransferase n=1 Tax=Paenibacillus sp. 481 TaxID=2835869 RepID=UPI001E3A111D|nr:GNAT family N-acetyltransferase [Paenibacillus sp. 481]UHA75520.1 GNAT family N-acetyltransferase [Paenibacillus sp. 481]